MVVNMTCGTSHSFTRGMRLTDEMILEARVFAVVAGAGSTQDEFGNLLHPATLPYLGLVWSSFQTPWPMSPRDFLFAQYTDIVVHEGDRHAVCLSFSVERPDVPSLESAPSLGFVRGRILATGYVARERASNPGMLDLTYTVSVDAGGVLPGAFVMGARRERSCLRRCGIHFEAGKRCEVDPQVLR